MGEDGVGGLADVGAAELAAAGNGHGVVGARAALGYHEVVPASDLVEVRALGPDAVAEGAPPQSPRLALEPHRLEVELLEPDLPVPEVALALGRGAGAAVPGPLALEIEGGVDARRLGEPGGLGPGPGGVLRGDDEVAAVVYVGAGDV